MRLTESALCSCCYGHHPDKKYVDFEVAFDGAPVLDKDAGVIAIQPWDGMQSSHDDLLLCQDCLREALELLELKPELHATQFREINRLNARVAFLEGMIRRRDTEITTLRDSVLAPPEIARRGPGRPRKATVGA